VFFFHFLFTERICHPILDGCLYKLKILLSDGVDLE
jgi:hypothetical protein